MPFALNDLLEQVQSLETEKIELELACDHHRMFWQKAEERERGLKEQYEELRAFKESVLVIQSPDPTVSIGSLIRERDDLKEQLETYDKTLRVIAEQQQKALKIIESNGFVFDDIGREPGNWKHLAFSLYTDLCEIDTWTRNALEIEMGSNPASKPPTASDMAGTYIGEWKGEKPPAQSPASEPEA
jgi:hypothetical protein